MVPFDNLGVVAFGEQNAVPFDANAAWKEGDLIPDYVISRQDAKGSAADNNAMASWKDGTWTVVSGGIVRRAAGMLSQPTTAQSSGTRRPSSHSALSAPIAIASFWTNSAVRSGTRASSRMRPR